jgi:hypothetical protein
MKGSVMGIFAGNRIVEIGSVPSVFCHGTRRMELLPGDVVCLWQCLDEEPGPDGRSAYTRPVTKLYIPLRCFMWNKIATSVWAYEMGLSAVKPIVPANVNWPEERSALLM